MKVELFGLMCKIRLLILLLEGGRFEGLLAMGVMPHVRNEKFVLNNMKNIVKPGGKVFINLEINCFQCLLLIDIHMNL